jgi:hypothetical protein
MSLFAQNLSIQLARYFSVLLMLITSRHFQHLSYTDFCTIFNSIFSALYATKNQYMPPHSDGKKEEVLVDTAWIAGFNLADSIAGKRAERLYAFQRSHKKSYVPLIDEEASSIRVYDPRLVTVNSSTQCSKRTNDNNISSLSWHFHNYLGTPNSIV